MQRKRQHYCISVSAQASIPDSSVSAVLAEPRHDIMLPRFYMIRAFGEDARSNAVNDRACVLMICLYMPALASERGCPIRTQPLPQLPAWPWKTNSNAPLRRRAELPCIVLFECKHHRVLWPIVDAASGDCSFLLGCCDSSWRLWLLRCNAMLRAELVAMQGNLDIASDSITALEDTVRFNY